MATRNGSSARGSAQAAPPSPRWIRARLARIRSPSIHRTLHAQRTTVHDVEIRHRRPDVSMPEQFLHPAHVVPRFKQTRRERVAHRVRAHALRDPRRSRGMRQRLLNHGFMQVVP